MDIGAEFDDDYFEQPRAKKEISPQNYEIKFCSPLWFMESGAKEEVSEVLLMLKHQADYYYYRKKYSKAAEIYEHCLDLVPPSNNTWKREFMENLARSLLHINEPQKALEWSLKLHKNSVSPDQKTVAMNLLATVCHQLKRYEEELEALHWCLEYHKSCPEFWLRLALCSAGLFKLNLPEFSIHGASTEEEQEACCPFRSRQNSLSGAPLVENGAPLVENGAPLVKNGAPFVENSDTSSATLDSSADCTTNSIDTHEGVIPNVCSTTPTNEEVPSKCDVCTISTQFVSSCLIHTKMLIESGGPNLLDLEKDERIKRKIESSLNHMEVDQTFIDVASQMLGTNFLAQLQACDKNALEAKSESTPSEND